MKELIEYLAKEWKTLSSAPMTFLITFTSAFGLAFVAVRWRYEGIVQSLGERLEAQKERALIKDEQLDEYRQRLHVSTVSGTEYSLMTNRELRERALTVVSKIREFLRSAADQKNSIFFEERLSMSEARTEEDRNKILNYQTNEMMRRSVEINSEYDRLHKVDLEWSSKNGHFF